MSRLTRLSPRHMVAICLLLTLGPLLVLAYLSTTLATTALTREISDRTAESATLSAASTQQQMLALLDTVGLFSNRQNVIDALKDGDPATFDLPALDRHLTYLTRNQPDIFRAFIVDTEGNITNSAPGDTSLVGHNFAHRDWYQGVRASGEPYLSEAYVTDYAGHPTVIAAAAPLRSTAGRVLAYAVALYPLARLQTLTEQVAGQAGLTLTVTDQRGVQIAGPIAESAALTSLRSDAGVRSALAGRPTVVHTRDRFAAYAPAPRIGWTVKAEIPADRALAPLTTFRYAVLAITGLLAAILLGAITLIALVMRERERAETELRKTAFHLTQANQALVTKDAFFQLSADMLGMANFAGFFVEVNPSCRAMLGWEPEEFMAQPFLDLVHPEDLQATQDEMGKLAEGATTLLFTNRYRCKDGSYKWLTWSARPDTVAGAIYCVARDVTPSKRNEQALRRQAEELVAANAELERASRVKSEFLTNMSHELRTPLNAILGFAEVLIDGPDDYDHPTQHSFLETIHSSGKHLLGLVNDILDLAKVESGQMRVEVEQFDLADLIAEAVTILEPLAAQKRMTIQTDVCGDPTLLADRAKVKQILLNLLSNAVKFTPEKGAIEVRSVRGAETMEIRVIDNGAGIPEADQERIFDEFQQLDSRANRRHQGTGLGLALIKRFCELQGGQVAVESRPGHGSRFIVTLPLAVAGSEAEAFADNQATDLDSSLDVSDDRPLILVVEDDARTAALLRRQLERGGYRSVAASGGREALRLARELLPAVITLDIRMDGIDGWQVLQELKADPTTDDIPVVIVSAVEEDGLARALGASGLLVKPVDYRALLKLISGVAPTASEAGPVRVLVVDDEPSSRQLLTAILEPAGFSVLTAEGGAAGIAAARQEVPDLILLDLMMPEVSGFDVLATLKANPRTCEVPVVIVTAKQLTARERKILHDQTSAIFRKSSMAAVDVLAQINRIISERRRSTVNPALASPAEAIRR